MMVKLPRCPECLSFRIWVILGDVKGKSILDAWEALDDPKPYPQSFTTRHYSYIGCRACGHRWDYSEKDGVRLTLSALPPTLFNRIKSWFSGKKSL